MNTSALDLLKLDQPTPVYMPGDTMSGNYRLDALAEQSITSVELSVMWYTEGKGDEDLAVHFFDRLQAHGSRFVELSQPRQFSTRLPNSPLSYSGLIVQIRWCVRMRVFLAGGKDLFFELPFQLGTVPAPSLPESAATTSTIDASAESANSKTLPLSASAAAHGSVTTDVAEP